jgi:hypothetical protein
VVTQWRIRCHDLGSSLDTLPIFVATPVLALAVPVRVIDPEHLVARRFRPAVTSGENGPGR